MPFIKPIGVGPIGVGPIGPNPDSDSVTGTQYLNKPVNCVLAKNKVNETIDYHNGKDASVTGTTKNVTRSGVQSLGGKVSYTTKVTTRGY